MNQIETVRLENFQSHLDTTLAFEPGLNVIVGQSDSGKTAILRAIRWVLFNQPRGTSVMRVGADFVRVTVRFTNETVIIRERSPSKNRYMIRKPNEDELILEGFGTHVPKEVVEAHGMNPLRLDHDHDLQLHISQQLEGPFLLEQTPALRAKTIGRISGAHFLDMAIRDTSKDLSQLQQQIKYDEQDAKHIEEQLQPYDDLEAKGKQVEKAESQLSLLQASEARRTALLQLQKALQDNDEQQQSWHQYVNKLNGIVEWEKNAEKLERLIDRVSRYQSTYNEIYKIDQGIETCQRWMKKTEEVNKAKENVGHLVSVVEGYEKLQRIAQYYRQLKDTENRAEKLMNETSFTVHVQDQQLNQIEGSLLRYTTLTKKREELSRLERDGTSARQQQERLHSVEQAREKLEHLAGAARALHSYVAIQEQYHTVEKRVHEGQAFVQSKVDELEQLQHEYEHQLLRKGTCPTCGGEVNLEQTKKLFENE